MKNFEINRESIFEIDKSLEGQDLKEYDLEIEKIVNNLWVGIGEFEEILSPFFTTYLNDQLLPSLYINYLSLVKLEAQYTGVNVKVSTSIIDIIGKKLNFNLDANRIFFDSEFQLNNDFFSELNPKFSGSLLRRILRNIKQKLLLYWQILMGIDVIYMNAGKLKQDFALIPKALNADYIPHTSSKKKLPNIDSIKNIVKSNIESIDLSIPTDLIIELLEQNIFKHLSITFNRIFILSEFIDNHKVKLVIASSATNDAFLCLLAASKLSQVESLLVTHGFPTSINPWLDSYCNYQGTLNDFEKQYYNTKQIRFKAGWFE